MADIKFMNLSENDNPATTDSVLIGNSEDGLRRTTLGNIGSMFSTHNILHFEKVNILTATQAAQITDPSAQTFDIKYDLEAPAVPGYTFYCWIGYSTNGFASAGYINNQDNPNGSLWLVQAKVNKIRNSGNSVTVTALYVKNEVA